MNDQPTLGLLDRLRQATSPDEITALLSEGATYKYASQSTKNKWARVASAILAQLAKESANASRKHTR